MRSELATRGKDQVNITGRNFGARGVAAVDEERARRAAAQRVGGQQQCDGSTGRSLWPLDNHYNFPSPLFHAGHCFL